jgi:manganese transport protein
MMTVAAVKKGFPLKTVLRFVGPSFLVTVGFIDPGNWATNIEGGSRFGYDLLWVITLSTIMLIVIQHMAAKLGIATGKSLAVNIRDRFAPRVSALLGVTVVLACVATDAAELIGGAIGFNLLFGMPRWLGALVTVLLEVFLIVSQRYHRIEVIIIAFLSIISLCYLVEILIVKPDWETLAPSLVIPSIDRSSIYVAMAMLGAVVMPHNIFLHSNVIHSRKWGISELEKKALLRYEKIDTFSAMLLGWVVNSAMIIVAAAVFFRNHVVVDSIEQAPATLEPLAGPLAGLLFAVALVLWGRLLGHIVHGGGQRDHRVPGKTGRPPNPALQDRCLYNGHSILRGHSSPSEHVSHSDLQPGRVEPAAALYVDSSADSFPRPQSNGRAQERQPGICRRRDHLGCGRPSQHLPHLLDSCGRRIACRCTAKFLWPLTARP